MTEMRDAVALMCIFPDFKRVEPATTIAGVQSQPFSFRDRAAFLRLGGGGG